MVPYLPSIYKALSSFPGIVTTATVKFSELSCNILGSFLSARLSLEPYACDERSPILSHTLRPEQFFFLHLMAANYINKNYTLVTFNFLVQRRALVQG